LEPIIQFNGGEKMLKRKCILLSIIVVVSLSISPFVQFVRAGDGVQFRIKDFYECIILEESKSIKVFRTKSNNYCASEDIDYFENQECKGTGKKIKATYKSKKPPKGVVIGYTKYGCPEQILAYPSNSYCYSYSSGGMTWYIPPNCNN
jgi:hypothetical protein